MKHGRAFRIWLTQPDSSNEKSGIEEEEEEEEEEDKY
jgi:hypothetical protein